jgi:hypothetical protein
MWFILLKEKTILESAQQSYYKNLTCSEGCSLCSRRFSFIMSDLVGLPRPCPCCLRLCWAMTAYLSRLLGGWALPQPPSQADPIFLRSQAMAHVHVGHTKDISWPRDGGDIAPVSILLHFLLALSPSFPHPSRYTSPLPCLYPSLHLYLYPPSIPLSIFFPLCLPLLVYLHPSHPAIICGIEPWLKVPSLYYHSLLMSPTPF